MTTETERCTEPYAVGSDHVRCQLRAGHEGWHTGTVKQRREIHYDTAVHVSNMTDTVTWEPLGARLGRVLPKRKTPVAAGEADLAEELHAEHHQGVIVPDLDSCPDHDRGDYEARVKAMQIEAP